MSAQVQLLCKRAFSLLFILIISHAGHAQCSVSATANQYEITCGESVELTAFGQSSGTVILSEDFNTGGFGPGWGSTPGSTSFSNPCSPGGVDGTPHAWMDNNTSVPRTLESASYNLTAATAGVTICFDLLFAEQGGSAPCEGPDEPDEGVYLQYSTDGGATWITIHYFDPNGGNDPLLTNWNNWCFQIPAAAITSNTMFRWHQTADSGADYDHWGIDNVEIYQNDVNSELVWLHDGYSYGVGNPGGANPNLVTPTSTTTYTAELTTGTGSTCTEDVTIIVNPPVYDVNLSVNPSTPLCPGDCADITGNAEIILDPGGIETHENNEFGIIAGTPGIPGIPPFIPPTPGDINAEMNINVVGVNQPTVTNGLITTICLNGFSMNSLGGNSSLADLEIILTCPSGTSISLVNVGDLSGNLVTNMCFEMGAAPISSGSQPYAGTFAPAESFNNLNGCDANGVWNITIQGVNNDLSLPIGGITGWSITFDNPPLTQPVNASWSPGTSLSSTNTVNTQACPNTSTNYTLTLDNGTPGCPTFDTIIPITVNPCGGCTPPNLIINNLNACAPNTVDLNNAIGVGSDPANVTFYNTQNDADNATNPIGAIVSTSGSYWIRAEDPNDPTCFLSYEVIVTIDPQDDASFSLSDFCEGAVNTATISGTTGGTFAFNPPPGDGSSIDPNTGEITNGVGGTTYTVEYTTNGTCPATSTENVTVLAAPVIDAGPDQTICDGDPVTLTANNPNNATINWDNGVSDGVSFTPSVTTTYTVDADLNGCTASDQVDIIVNSTFTFGVTTNDPSSCGANDGSITITGLNPNTSYDVSYDNGGTTIGPTNLIADGAGDIMINNLSSGGYNNIVITPSSGCSATDNTGWVLTDPNAPSIDAGPDQTICDTDPVTLTANNPNGATINWDNGVSDGVSFTPSATTTYTVDADLNGCIASDQVTITVNPLPNPVISNVNDLCVNDPVINLSSNLSGGTYNGNGVTGNQFDPNIAGIGTHTITYDYTDVNGCSNGTSIDIDVIATPAFSVTGYDPLSCNSNDGEIHIENLSPNTNYSLTYKDNGSVVGPNNITTNGSGAFIINTLAAGNYTDFIIALASGCSSTDNSTITLIAPNSPSIDAGQDITICQGSSVTLTANNPSGSTIIWNNGISDGIAFTPTQTTTYTVTADPNGCPASDQVTVTVSPIPNVTANATSIDVCQGDPITLFGTGATNYQWDNAVTDNVPFTATNTTTYSVTGTDNNGCQNTDQITVTVHNLPVVNFTGNNLTGCTPLKVNFTANSNNASHTCLWNFGDGNTSTDCNNPNHEYTSDGCYDVSLTVTDNNGCANSMIVTDYICVDPNPIAAFDQDYKLVTIPETEVTFLNESVGAEAYNWNFYDFTNSLEENPSHKFPEEPGKYLITLTASTANGCSDEAISYVIVEEDLVFYVPNTFTPDGDPYNQEFKPVMTSGYDPYNYTLYIFNRWGEVLFESHNTTTGWDGTYMGNPVQDGTYVWKIIIHDSRDDERKEFNGHVNVLR